MASVRRDHVADSLWSRCGHRGPGLGKEDGMVSDTKPVGDERWTGGGNTLTDGQSGRNGRWESTSIPIQWADPQPLPAIRGTPQVGKDFFLDESCAVKGFANTTQLDDPDRCVDPPKDSLQRGT